MNYFKKLRNTIYLNKKIKECKRLNEETKKQYKIVRDGKTLKIINNNYKYLPNHIELQSIEVWSTLCKFNPKHFDYFITRLVAK